MVFYRLIKGDCFKVMPKLASESIDLIISDPPTHLSHMMGLGYEEYYKRLMTECLRLGKKDLTIYFTVSVPRYNILYPIMKNLFSKSFENVELLRWSPQPIICGSNQPLTVTLRDIKDILAVPEKLKVHPAQRPIALFQKFVYASSVKGDVVLDMFIGSGTSMIAAYGFERSCIGIEIDGGFCNLVKRFCSSFPNFSFEVNE